MEMAVAGVRRHGEGVKSACAPLRVRKRPVAVRDPDARICRVRAGGESAYKTDMAKIYVAKSAS